MRRSSRRILAASAASALALLGVGLIAAPANAADIVVDSAADDGSGGTTLREAIAASNGGDTIVFDPTVFSTPQTINLDSAALVIAHTLTIDGPGSDLLTIQRDDANTVYPLVFVIPPPQSTDPIDVEINGVTLNDVEGGSDLPLGVGFIAISGSELRDLTMADVVIQNQNGLDNGAAISVVQDGQTSLTDVVLQDNSSSGTGGAVYASGFSSFDLDDSLVVGNEATGFGGGLALDGIAGPVSITGSTIADNTAVAGGGGVFANTVVNGFFLEQSVVSGNTVTSGNGGGVYTQNAASLFQVYQSLIVDNDALFEGPGTASGGGLYFQSATNTVSINNSTIAGGSAERGIAIGIASMTRYVYIQSSTIDVSGTDEYAIWIGAATEDDTETGLDINWSTLVGPGVLHIGTNGGLGGWLGSSIADGTGQDAIVVDDGDPYAVTWSLISSAASPDVDPVENVTFGVTDMGLAPLGYNGGVTPTRMLLPGSPAYNGSNPEGFTPDFDQRGEGFPRVIAGVMDIGAIEAPEEQPVLPATGSTVPMWIPIVGGVVLLLGAAAVVFTIVSRRRLHAAEGPAAPADPADAGTPPTA